MEITKLIQAMNTPIPEEYRPPLTLRCNVCGKHFEQKVKFGGLVIFITCEECR